MKNIITGQFNDSLFPIMDGVGLVAKNYAYWLNKKYGTGYCIGPQVPGHVDTDTYILRFPTIPIPGHVPYRYGLPRFGNFRKQLNSIEFDIVHSHCPFVSGKEALRIARKRNIPLISTFHSKYREDFLRAFKTQYLADKAVAVIMHYYEKTDLVWVPNEPTVETLRSYGYKGLVEVAENGTDLQVPTEQQYIQLKNQGRALTGVTEDDFVLLFVGQHRWEKNVRLILEGLHKVAKRNKQFKAFFVGSGPELKEMKKLVESYSLSGSIRFEGIIKDREVLKAYYAVSDVFMLPSLYDTASLVMKEAAAFHVPTIYVKEAATAKGIECRSNGFLTENTSDSFADMIVDLIENPALVKKAGAGALKTIYTSWEMIVDSVYERYLKIIRDRKA